MDTDGGCMDYCEPLIVIPLDGPWAVLARFGIPAPMVDVGSTITGSPLLCAFIKASHPSCLRHSKVSGRGAFWSRFYSTL